MIIKGKVIDTDQAKAGGTGSNLISVPGAKIYISDEKGKITPMKIGTVTDTNGFFELDVPTIKNPMYGMPDIPNFDGKYLTASYGGKTRTNPLAAGDYNFNLAKAKIYNLDEVTVKAKRPIYTAELNDKKDDQSKAGFSWDNMEPWQKGVVAGLGLAFFSIVAYGVYNASKQS